MDVSLNKDVLARLQEVWIEIGLSEAERVRRSEALREQIIRVYVDTLESAADERDALENELDAAEALLLELQAEVTAAQKSAPPSWLPADVLGPKRVIDGLALERSWEPVQANVTSELSIAFGAGGIGRTAVPDTSVSCSLISEQPVQRQASEADNVPPMRSAVRAVEDAEHSGRTGDTSGRQGTLLQCLEEVSQRVAALEAQKRLYVQRLGELQKRILTLWVDELGEVVDDLPEEYRDALVITGSSRNRNIQSLMGLEGNLSPNQAANFTQITTIASDLTNSLQKVSIRNYGPRIRALEAKITELMELRQQRVETIASLLVSMKSLLRRLCITLPEETESEIDRLAILFDGTQEPLGASLVSIDVLTARVACLEREIESRVEELDRVSGVAAELYRLLRYPSERFSAFQAEHSTLSKKSLEAWHEHVEALRATREQRLRALIANEREHLNALWSELDVAPAQRVSFAFCSNDEISEEVLQAIERETSRLEAIARRIRPIHELLARREELLVKKQELEREMQNPERLFGRSGGRRIVGGLLREEQLRKQVRQLPKVNALLQNKLEQYEQEFQKRFIHNGVDVLENLRQETAAKCRASRPARSDNNPGSESGRGMPWVTSPVRSGAVSGGTGRYENGARPTGNRAAVACAAPSTWGGNAATKVLAAEVRKHVRSKREPDVPMAMIARAKTTTLVSSEKDSKKGTWCAWLSAEGSVPALASSDSSMKHLNEAPRSRTAAELRESPSPAVGVRSEPRQSGVDVHPNRILASSDFHCSQSRPSRVDLSAENESTSSKSSADAPAIQNDSSVQSVRVAGSSSGNAVSGAGGASTPETGSSCREHVGAETSKTMRRTDHMQTQAIAVDPATFHTGGDTRAVSRDPSSNDSGSHLSAQCASEAATETGIQHDQRSGEVSEQGAGARETLALPATVLASEPSALSVTDTISSGPPSTGSTPLACSPLAACGSKRQVSPAVPEFDQENTSFHANNAGSLSTIVAVQPAKESLTAPVAPGSGPTHLKAAAETFEAGDRLQSKRARPEVLNTSPPGQGSDEALSGSATAEITRSNTSGPSEEATPRECSTASSEQGIHLEAAAAQGQRNFSCAESPIR
jgi:hypothetical protein